jgi:hypothetical protein
VFAFGVLLYEYACGVHPFASPTALGTVARVLESDVAPLSSLVDVPQPLVTVIARCLEKTAADRFGSAAELLGALDVADAVHPPPARHAIWWRAHQIVVAVLYIAGAILAWQNKEWIETPVTVAIFVALSGAATMAGVLRGHLVFTSLMNPSGLNRERRRMQRATRLLDVIAAALLFADAALIAPTAALRAVFALALALGLALAAFVLEPATTAAAFGENPEP